MMNQAWRTHVCTHDTHAIYILKVIGELEGFDPLQQVCACMCGWLDKEIAGECALYTHKAGSV